MHVETAVYQSPVGPLTLLESPEGPLVVEYPGRSARLRWTVRLRGAAPAIEIADGECARTSAWLDAYFAGRPPPFPFPRWLLRWFDVSAAQVAVFRALRRIPFGETRSYADVARQTGIHPRVVGQLVGSNHLSILVPCHRVVGKRGALVGYGGGVARKRWLLAHELRHAGVVLR
jgi:methylated-DNA-[protein]-cysteine S-methyltransferase